MGAVAPRGAAPETGHVGIGPRFVDEHEAIERKDVERDQIVKQKRS